MLVTCSVLLLFWFYLFMIYVMFWLCFFYVSCSFRFFFCLSPLANVVFSFFYESYIFNFAFAFLLFLVFAFLKYFFSVLISFLFDNAPLSVPKALQAASCETTATWR